LNAFEFTNNSISLHVGEQILPEMQFTPADATDKKVYFTSSNSTIAKVNEYGFIEALRNGNAIIYGTSRDGFYKDNIAIEVTNDAPVVSITAPEDLTSFSIDQSITVVADASDDLRVAAIEIFVNNQSVGTVTKAPWQLTLENVNSGYNSLTVKATDDHDGVTWAGPVRFYVDDPNAIPELLYKPINVYPNPAKKAIHFSIMPKEPAGMHVQIYNINGQKVISDYMEVLPSVEVNMPIDIQNLNSGMYFYRIIMDSSGKVNTINGNFIKQ
jgi:hypothetical protein